MNKVLIGFIVILVVFSSGAVYWIFTDLDLPFIGEDKGTGDSVQFGMIFSGGGVSPFPSAGTTGNTPNSIYFEKIL